MTQSLCLAGTWVTSAHISRVPWPRPPARAPDVAGQSGGVCAFSAVLLGCVRVGSQLPERGPILNIVLVHPKFRRGCPVFASVELPRLCELGCSPGLRVSSPGVLGVRVVGVFHVGALNTEKPSL